MSKLVFLKKEDNLFDKLRELPHNGASHGEASFGYNFELKDGGNLTIGQSDDDVTSPHILWLHYWKKE